MRKNLKPRSPELVLTRVLDALGDDLLAAADEEILAAARELGMQPEDRRSAAFAGLTCFERPQLSDFFDLDIPRALLKREPPEE